MFNRKNMLAALVNVALLSRLGHGARDKKALAPPAPQKSRKLKDTKGRDITVMRGYPRRVGGGRYRPHQSTRECLRRIGGGVWEQFKRDDRVRRGLPADKHEGT